MPRRKISPEELLSLDRSAIYDAEYYQAGCGPVPYERQLVWLSLFAGIANQLIVRLNPKTVLDVGCAMGMLVEAFRDRGVEAFGFDVSTFAIENVRSDIQSYCRVAAVTDPIEGRYDLVTCIEVLEHVLPEEAHQAIASMARVTDTVLFSSSPSDYTEPTHVNVQPATSWIRQFGEVGFTPDLRFDASFLAPHAILFRKFGVQLDAETAALFCEILSLRCALAESRQRVAQLNAELDAARAAPSVAGESDRSSQPKDLVHAIKQWAARVISRVVRS